MDSSTSVVITTLNVQDHIKGCLYSLLSQYKKPNEVISRQEILEKIWGFDVYPSSRTIDNFILTFRKIFEKDLPPSTYFKSIRGVGYKYTP